MKNFYRDMQPVADFKRVADAESYQAVPADWWVIITDVVNSTQAIERGEYKEVNTAGAISLVALANEKLHLSIPVVFGGDGIMLLTPPEHLPVLKDIFFGIRKFVAEGFSLQLRVGLVPVSDILKDGKQVLLGKFSAHNPFAQAIFSGDGIDAAEAMIKSSAARYELAADHKPVKEADFSGFSCPFREVPSADSAVLALIVKSRRDLNSYGNLIGELMEILGPENNFYPISFGNLYFGKTAHDLRAWVTVAAGANHGFKNWLLGIFLSMVMRVMGLSRKKMQSQAAGNLPFHTDHKKFDGTLKMVVRATEQTRKKVFDWLERYEASGDIFFGVHTSAATLVTCVFAGAGDAKEIHLIDGADGGYALAAKTLKAKLRI